MLQMRQGVGGGRAGADYWTSVPHLLNEDDVSMDLAGLQECGSQHLAHGEPQQTLVTGMALGGRGGTRSPLLPFGPSHTLCSCFRALLHLGWTPHAFCFLWTKSKSLVFEVSNCP